MQRPRIRLAARLRRLTLTAAAAAVVVVGDGSSAQAHGPAPVFEPVPLAVNNLPTVINNITAWIVGIIGAVALLFLTVGSARYLMAGDPSEAEQAKVALRRAGIGFALVMLAPILLAALKGILGV